MYNELCKHLNGEKGNIIMSEIATKTYQDLLQEFSKTPKEDVKAFTEKSACVEGGVTIWIASISSSRSISS